MNKIIFFGTIGNQTTDYFSLFTDDSKSQAIVQNWKREITIFFVEKAKSFCNDKLTFVPHFLSAKWPSPRRAPPLRDESIPSKDWNEKVQQKHKIIESRIYYGISIANPFVPLNKKNW
jgi:hypothetical protein